MGIAQWPRLARLPRTRAPTLTTNPMCAQATCLAAPRMEKTPSPRAPVGPSKHPPPTRALQPPTPRGPHSRSSPTAPPLWPTTSPMALPTTRGKSCRIGLTTGQCMHAAWPLTAVFAIPVTQTLPCVMVHACRYVVGYWTTLDLQQLYADFGTSVMTQVSRAGNIAAT